MNIRDVLTYINSQTDKQATKELRQVLQEDFAKLGIQNMESFAKGGRYNVKKTIMLEVEGEIRSVQAYDNTGNYPILATTSHDNKKRLGDYCIIPIDSIPYLHLLALAIQLNDKLNKRARHHATAKKE